MIDSQRISTATHASPARPLLPQFCLYWNRIRNRNSHAEGYMLRSWNQIGSKSNLFNNKGLESLFHVARDIQNDFF